MGIRYYTGIGSRKTPEPILSYMRYIAGTLNGYGYTLRSGHAVGADRAFESKANLADIYLPWEGFGVKPYKDDLGQIVSGNTIVMDDFKLPLHFDIYKQVCKNMGRSWGDMPSGVRKLTYRDVHQVIGHDRIPIKSDFVICWTNESGGTHYAMETANIFNVPVLNIFELGEEQTFIKLYKILNAKGKL